MPKSTEEHFRIYAAIERMRREQEASNKAIAALILVQTKRYEAQDATDTADALIDAAIRSVS